MLKITLFPPKSHQQTIQDEIVTGKFNFSVQQMLYFYIMLEKLPLVLKNSFCKFSLTSKSSVNTSSIFWPSLTLAAHRNSPMC